MKPFSQWMGDQAGTILDASHIGPHTGDVLPVVDGGTGERAEGWTIARQNAYEHWMRRMDTEGDFEY